jgi:hypothetical protein
MSHDRQEEDNARTMNTFLSRICLLMKIPRQFRLPNIQKTLVTEGYRLLCLLKGEKFTYPVLPSEEGSYIVTESIPSLRLTLFGKTIWCTDSIPLEYVPSPTDLEAQRELVDKVVARTKGPIHYVAIVHARNCRTEAARK